MSRPAWSRYGVAAAALTLTFLLKGPIEAMVGAGPPLILFVPAVTVGAWYGGLGPGLMTTALAVLGCIYLFLEPVGSFRIARPNDRLRLVLFVVDGVVTSTLMGRLRAALQAASVYRATLRDREARLQAVMDHAPALIYLKDIGGRYLLVNARWTSMFGLPASEAVGRVDDEILPADLAARSQAHDRAVVALGTPREWESLLELDDGPHTFLTVKFPVRDPSGRPYAVGGIATDITDRKRAERALAASEERFRSLSACSPVGIYETDPQGRCVYTNARCREIYGFTAEEALGDGWSRFIHPDDRDEALAGWLEAARAGREVRLEYRAVRPGGEVRWVRDRSAAILSDRGAVLGHVGTVVDITDQRRAADLLRRERDFAEGLIRAARAVIVVLDGAGRVVRANPFAEQVVGAARGGLLGLDWFDAVVADGHRDAARDAFARAVAEPAGCQATYPVAGRDGLPRELEWALRALAAVDGDAPGMLLIGHDLTELREAERRALQAERLAAIGQMVAGLAHESRNALQRGVACLDLLTIRFRWDEEPLGLIEGARHALDDLHRLFDEVRDYAAPIRLDRRPHDLGDLLREAWRLVEARRNGRSARLVVPEGPGPAVPIDRFRMLQVVRNILENALDAAPDPAEVVASWGPAELDGRRAVRLALRDNGPGIAPEARARLFEPFFTTKTRGTGLGMAISRRIVEAHGGRIAVADDGPGATFQLTLPEAVP